MIKGIDVSHWQSPAELPWGHLASAGYVFCIAKATDGTRRDPKFLEHIARARDVGMTIGAYHFFRQNVDPDAQLQAFLDALGAINFGPGCIIPALDLEKGPDGDGDSRPELFARAESIARGVQTRFGDCLIYGGVGFWRALGSPRWWADFPLWTAHYTKASTPLVPADGTWRIWQHASAPIPGIYAARLDQNVATYPLPLVTLSEPKLLPLERDIDAERRDRDELVKESS